MKLPSIDFKLFCIWFVICAVGGALICWFTVLPFWGGATLVAAALCINGLVAEVEDNAPGGFNNPGDKYK